MLCCWLIRHGESESNAGLPTSDYAQIKLTAKGVEQAQSVARAFNEEPTLIVASRYLRARQTALPTIDRFPGVAVEEWPVQEFAYLALPPDPMTVEERRPMTQAYWNKRDPFYVDGPGAESLSDLMGRAESFLQRLASYREGLIAVFTHGHFIGAVLWSLLHGPVEMCPEAMGRFHQFLQTVPFANGALVKLQFSVEGDDGVSRMISEIVTSHLAPDPATNSLEPV